MARIKINDLPRDRKITKEEMQKVTGGSLMGAMTGAARDIRDAGSDILHAFSSMTMALVRGSGGNSSDDSTTDSSSSSGFKPSLDTYKSSGG